MKPPAPPLGQQQRSASGVRQAFGSFRSLLSGGAADRKGKPPTAGERVGAHKVTLRGSVHVLHTSGAFRSSSPLWKPHRAELLLPDARYRLYCTPLLRLTSDGVEQPSSGKQGMPQSGRALQSGKAEPLWRQSGKQAGGAKGAVLDRSDLLGGLSTAAAWRGSENVASTRSAGPHIDIPLRTAVISAVASADPEHTVSISVEEVSTLLAFSSAAAATHWLQRLNEAILGSTDELWLAEHALQREAAAVQAAWRGLASRRSQRCPVSSRRSKRTSAMTLPTALPIIPATVSVAASHAGNSAKEAIAQATVERAVEDALIAAAQRRARSVDVM